jgi:tetratricopeptide (TPR) repeat protein
MDSKRLRPFLERAKSGIFQSGCDAAIAAVSCVRLAGQSRSHSASGTPSASSQAGARNRALAEAQRGVALAHESKYKQAIAHYRAAEALDPHLPGLYLSLGLAYFKAQRLSDAAVALERAVKADPDNLQARTDLGMSYYGMRRFADAAEQFHAELKIEPDDNQSLTYLGDPELQLRRRPQAEAHLREALRLDPNSHLAQLDLRILFTDENKPAAAERHMREPVRLDPSDPDGHYHLARLMLRMGQRKEAMQEFSEIKRFAREKDPPPLLSQIGGAKKGTKPDRTSAVPEVGKH